MDIIAQAAPLLALLPTVDTPVDLASETATIATVMSGVGTALGGVLAAGLAIAGIKWGIPQVVRFFKRVSA